MSQPPNILILYSDQHAARISGYAGDTVVRTPNLDALAAGGTTFTNAYCPSPICLPSRMSFLTGQEPAQQDCWTNRDILPSGIPTFAHSLGAAGYRPWLAGRMHSIGPDQARGYVRREIGDHSPNWLGGQAHDLGPLARANDPWRESLTASGAGNSAYETYDKGVTDAAVGMLREAGERQLGGDGTPFALTVGWILPHAPYVCSQELYDYYDGKVPQPTMPTPDPEHSHDDWWRRDRGIADTTPEEVNRARAAYYGLVETVDTQVGRVLAALDAAGLAETTLVVYLSDHGEHLGERGLWWKSTLYDVSSKVPLVVSGPGVAEGASSDAVVNLTDLTATLLDVAGAQPLPCANGRSFRELLTDLTAPWIDRTYSEYVNDGAAPWSGGRMVIQRMCRDGPYKYIYHHGHAGQLFDLLNDPMEARDLAQDPAFCAIAAQLRAQVLDGWSPDRIEATLVARQNDLSVLEAWGRVTEPNDLIRWNMSAADSWLATDKPQR